MNHGNTGKSKPDMWRDSLAKQTATHKQQQSSANQSLAAQPRELEHKNSENDGAYSEQQVRKRSWGNSLFKKKPVSQGDYSEVRSLLSSQLRAQAAEGAGKPTPEAERERVNKWNARFSGRGLVKLNYCHLTCDLSDSSLTWACFFLCILQTRILSWLSGGL